MADRRVNVGVGYTVDKRGLEEMQSYFQRIANQAAEPGNKLNAGLQQAGQTAKTLDGILEKTFNTNLGTLNVTKFNQELQKSGLTIKQVKTDLMGAGEQGSIAYNKLTQAILSTNIQLKQSSKLLDSMFTTFKNTVRYGISSSIFNNFTNSIQKAYEYTRKLDTSLNDIRIVTGKSTQEMDKFAEKANNAAKSLGASTLDMTQASLIYYQQGLSDAEAQARAETTVKVANVTGQKADEVSEQLTSVWNGYKVSAAETETYIDKLAAVAATTASDLEELSTGMSKVASAAAAMGVDFDDLTAQISTIVSVTRQAPESVGTALKTIYARIGDLKVDGVDEFGVKLGEVSSQLEVMGIHILDQEGNMRDMTSIMTEVADKWNYWTEAQKQAAAVAIAGKRQYNNLIALFENWDMYSEALDTAKNSLGTLQKQQDIYMESTQAKLTRLRATWQDLYKSVGDTKTINNFIDGARNLVQVFDNFTDSFGGGLKSIAAFGAVIANVFNKQIVASINGAIQRSQILKTNIENAKTQAQVIEAGTATEHNGSPYAKAEAAASAEQLRIIQEIRSVQSGLTEEQQQTLINSTTEIKNLTQKKVLYEEIAKKAAAEYLTEEQINQILSATPAEVETILTGYTDIEEAQNESFRVLEQIQNLTTQTTKDYSNAAQIYQKINDHIKIRLNGEEKISQQEKKILVDIQKILLAETNEAEAIKAINKYWENSVDCMITVTDETAAAAEALGKASQNSFELQENINNLKQGNEGILEIGRQANVTGLSITTVTSALSTLAITWSSINSLSQTWSDENISFGDKLTQSMMTLGMTLPMVASAFTKLKAMQDAYTTSQAKTVAMNSLLAESEGIKLTANEAGLFTMEVGIKGQKQKVLLTEAEIKSVQGLAIAEAEENGVKTLSIIGDGSEIVSKTLLGKVITGLTAKFTALNAAIMANPLIAIGAALVGSIAALIALEKKYQKDKLESAQATIDDNAAKQEEIQVNKDLVKSYDEIYNKYKANKASKEEVGKVAEQLAEKYKIEGAELAILTGNYEDFTEALKQARKEELQEGIKSNIEAEKGSAEKIRQAARKGNGHIVTNWDQNAYDGYEVGLGGDYDSTKWRAALKANSSHYNANTGMLEVANIDNPKEMLALYNEVKKTVDEFTDKNDAGYKEASEWLEKMEETISEINALYRERSNLNQDMAWEAVDIDNAGNDIDIVSGKLDQLRSAFNVANGDAEEGSKQLQKYLINSSNETAKYIGTVKAQLEKSDILNFDELFGNANKGIDGVLSKAEKEFTVNNKIDFSSMINYDADKVKSIIEAKMKEVSAEGIDVVVSLRAKITSDKKLTKQELEDALGEKSELLEDTKFGADFADFDNKSSLEQIELLNNLLTERINLIEKEKRTRIETNKTIIAAEEQYQQELKQRLEYLQEQKENAKDAPQYQQELTIEIAKVNNELQGSVDKVKELQNEIDHVDYNEQKFQGLIAGVDGVIDEVKTLKSLTDSIGEGWVVAADKLETFAKNFPELMADQKNYNYLQDGSLHLTEEGQEAFKAQLEARKQEIILQNEAYKKELQITADKKLAEYEYYKNMAKHLERYSKGQESEAQLEANLKKGLEEYKVRMMNITGAKDEELNKIIQENNNKTADNTIENVHDMFNAYQQLGAAIQACQTGSPMPSWSDNRASAPEVDTTGHEITFEVDFNTPELSKADAEAMARMAREAADLAYNEYSTAISKMASADAQTNALLASLDMMGQNKKGKDKKQEKLDEEFDRYYDIKKAIDLVNVAIDKLQKKQEKLHGKELIQALQNENKLIQQQAQNYEALYEQQKVELDEVQGTLMGFGAEFDDNGFLTNYAALTASALEQYQAAIAKYNAGLITEESKEAYQQSYEQMKKYLERYDALFYNEMKDTKDKLDDYYRQTMENNLKIWETEIQISLDTKQAERDWADFLKDINDDFRKVYKDLNIEMDHLMTKVETYSGMGTIETDLQAIHDVMVEIDKMNSGQASDMFESISDAQEKLKELDQQLEDDSKNMKQLWEDAWNTYLDGIDQASDKLDFMNNRFENLNEELEFQGKLIELLYGEKAYELMSKLYKGQEAAMQSNLASVKAQADMWHQLWVESGATLENQGDWNEDQQKYYDNWLAQQSKLNDLTTEYIELLQRDYINTVNEVLESLEHGLTGGGLLEQVNEQWQKITDYTDKYYDGIEHAYEVQKFANKIDEDIAKTAGIKNQQKLQALREKEITYLREKQNLTKYDLDAAEARYQIALKEIALEEAQENKSSMKLVRNEEGNWAYQYMADADEVAAKQDDLLTSYGDLYKLAGDAYQENLSELQELESAYLESARKIYEDQTMAEEERNAKLAELEEWYQETKNRLVEENELYRQDLQVSGAGLLLQVYQQDEEAYAYMTESEQAMLDALIGSSISSYQDLQDKCEENYRGIMDASATAIAEIRADWTASAQLIADAWAADDGVSVMSKITWAHEQISEATLTYQTLVDECAEQVGRDFGEEGIAGAIDTATEATVKLQDAVETMCTTSEKALTALQTMLGKVEQAWVTQKEQVSSAITEVREYMAILGQAKVLAAQDYSITGGLGNLGDYSSLGQGDGGDGKFKDEVYPDKPPYYLVGEDAYGHSVIFATQNRQGNTFNSPDAVDEFAKANFEDQARSGEVRSLRSLSAEAWDKFKTKEYPTWGRLVKFDTGGYTGDWGTDGRLAFLHQKELVLNAKDTENFLNGVSLLRDMVALNGSIEQSIAAAVGNMALQLGGVHAAKIAGGTSQSTPALAGDTYYVTADFPNANNAEEIKQAIMSLPNIVSQAIGKNKL